MPIDDVSSDPRSTPLNDCDPGALAKHPGEDLVSFTNASLTDVSSFGSTTGAPAHLTMRDSGG